MKLTVIIPVYNEASTLKTLLDRVLAVPLEKEVIVVDDGSDVATKELLKTAASETASQPHNSLQLFTHVHNSGKGSAIRTALARATGDVVIIQDADLEYFPEDYPILMDTYVQKKVKAVYGVRDLSGRSTIMRLGNRAMTLMTNLLFGSRLHDMETCYKMIDRRLMQSLNLESRRFEIEPEITAKLLKKGVAIAEAPIRYEHREEGKKLTPLDGIPTLLTLLKLRLSFWRNPTPITGQTMPQLVDE